MKRTQHRAAEVAWPALANSRDSGYILSKASRMTRGGMGPPTGAVVQNIGAIGSMSAMAPHLIAVIIRRDDSGWFIATSADCPGLVVSDPDRNRVVDLVPEAIELLYEAQRHQRVRVVRLSHPGDAQAETDQSVPFAALPEEIAGGPRAN